MSTSPRIKGFSNLVEIGTGGSSTVYRADQDRFNRPVAVKVLDGRLADEGELRRLERECRVAGAVSGHPNVVTVFGAGEVDDGRPYIVMDYVVGGSLSGRVQADGPLTQGQTLDVGVKIAGALEVVHQAGLLHRHIKPQNILISDLGEPALADCGISVVARGLNATTGPATPSLLHTPPEVLEGEPSNAASDIYSLGSTLYALLAGHAPFHGKDGEGIAVFLRRVLTDPPPPIAGGRVATSLEAVLAVALAKSPADRFPSARALAQALQEQKSILNVTSPGLPFGSGAVLGASRSSVLADEVKAQDGHSGCQWPS